MKKWKKNKLSQLCTKIGSGATPRGGDSSYQSHGISLIRSQNILDFVFSKNGLAFIDDVQAKQLANVEIKERDVLINITGDSVARVCQVINNVLPARVNQHVAILRTNQSKLNPEFLKYALLTLQNKEMLLSLASTGATRKALTKSMLEEFEIDAPEDVATQSRIASILSSLDDKIELNRRMNQTLEQIAQALFNHYFVDNIDPDNLPKGWKYGKLEKEISIKHGFAFQGKYFVEEANDDLLLSPGNFKIGGGFNYHKFKYYNGEFPQAYTLEKNDLIVTMTDLSKDGDTLGFSALTPEIPGKKLLHNQRIGKVLFNKNPNLKYYLYWLLRTDEYRAFVLGSATGTTVRHTSPTRICEYNCVIPNGNLLEEFNRIIEPLCEKEMFNHIENSSLSKIRDTLLPRLMSGEIDVDVLMKKETLLQEETTKNFKTA